MASDTQRFLARPHNGIYTGLAADGCPVFATWGLTDCFVVVFFDSEGAMRTFEEHPPLKLEYEKSAYLDENEKRYQTALQTTLNALGLVRLQPVYIQKFLIVKHLIGIRRYPNSLQRFLKEGIEYSEAEVAELRDLYHKLEAEGEFEAFSCFLVGEHLEGRSPEYDESDAQFFEKWTEEGSYVLYCGIDYWCNADGFVTAT
jgi:hypothetical protein